MFRATKNAEHFFERKQKGANNKTTNLIGKYLIKRKRAQEGKRWKGNKFYWKISVVTVIAQNLSETVVQWGVWATSPHGINFCSIFLWWTVSLQLIIHLFESFPFINLLLFFVIFWLVFKLIRAFSNELFLKIVCFRPTP